MNQNRNGQALQPDRQPSAQKAGSLRAIGYCRTSGEGQRDNTSIPTQKRAIEDFSSRNGWLFSTHYVDESKSGAKIAGRDAFQQMMKDAALGSFDVIVPFDVSRFARDGVDILGNAKFLRSNFGVHVVDTKGGFDSRPGGNVLLNFVHAGVSEYERLKIMERMIGGRIHNAQQGKPWSGKQPFGRAYDRATGTWHITDRGKRMRQMLERYANGEGFVDLLKEFTEFSSNQVVLFTIRSSQLSGTYVKEFNIPELNIHGLKIPIPQIPEVIPANLMQRVEARLAHRRTWNKEHRRRYVLTGYVRCGHCGTPLTGNCTGGRLYYRHCNPMKDTPCAFHSIPKEDLVDPALDYLFSFFTDEPTFQAAVTAALPDKSEQRSLEREQAQVSASLAKTHKEIDNLVAAIRQGVDPSLLIDSQQQLKRDKERHTERLSAVEAQLAAMPDPEALKHQATAIRLKLLDDVRQRDWRKLSNEEVRRFLIFLFGENPRQTGSGIAVTRERGRWRIAFQGNVKFHHDLADGRPLSHAVRDVAARHNQRIARELEQVVDLTRQT